MSTRYSTAAIAPWLIAAAMIAGFILGQSMESLPRGPERASFIGGHILLGVLVMALLGPRIVTRAQVAPAFADSSTARS